MPSSTEILILLQKISNEQLTTAIIFHLIIYSFSIALLGSWRPSNKMLGFLLTLPLLSVSALAWLYGNPFNGTMFGLFFVLLLIISIWLSGNQTITTSGWLLPVALVMIIFGLVYPHFIEKAIHLYAIAAPTGLIPCPTLSLVVGFTMLFNGLYSKKWTITLAIIGLFYGLFGALKLGVYIDIFLIVGSSVLLYQGFSLKVNRER